MAIPNRSYSNERQHQIPILLIYEESLIGPHCWTMAYKTLNPSHYSRFYSVFEAKFHPEFWVVIYQLSS